MAKQDVDFMQDDVQEGFLDWMRDLFYKSNDEFPNTFAAATDEGIAGCPLVFRTSEDKDKFEAFMVRSIMQGKFKSIAMVTESWLTKMDKGDDADIDEVMKKAGELRPNTKEVVTAIFSSAKGDKLVYAEIKREGGKRELGPWVVMNDVAQIAGRFSQLFRKAAAIMN